MEKYFDALEPALAMRFSVAIGGLTIERFVSCDGLSAEWELEEFRAGGQNDHMIRRPKGLKHTNVRLTRAIDRQSAVLAAWFSETRMTMQRHNATIAAYDGNKREVAAWHLIGAWPVKYTGPQLSATSALAAVETLEISHNGFSGPVPS
jgi:phage tail-like protein